MTTSRSDSTHNNGMQPTARRFSPAAKMARRAAGSDVPSSPAPMADGYDIRMVQELLGHSDVRTTMIYTHVLNRGGRAVLSPAENQPI